MGLVGKFIVVGVLLFLSSEVGAEEAVAHGTVTFGSAGAEVNAGGIANGIMSGINTSAGMSFAPSDNNYSDSRGAGFGVDFSGMKQMREEARYYSPSKKASPATYVNGHFMNKAHEVIFVTLLSVSKQNKSELVKSFEKGGFILYEGYQDLPQDVPNVFCNIESYGTKNPEAWNLDCSEGLGNHSGVYHIEYVAKNKYKGVLGQILQLRKEIVTAIKVIKYQEWRKEEKIK